MYVVKKTKKLIITQFKVFEMIQVLDDLKLYFSKFKYC